MATEAVVTARNRRGSAWINAVREIGLLTCLFLAYKGVRQAVRGRVDVAFDNARRVISFEAWLQLDFEAGLQRLALHSTQLVVALNRYYVSVHFTAALVFVVWIYLVHRDWYPHIRRLLIASTGISLILHVVFPLAPPRMMPGFVDTMAVFGPNSYADGRVASLANQYAAMPSVHFAWSVLIAYGVIRCSRSRVRWLSIVHPVVTLAAIILTANHYWLDAAVALLVLGIAFVVEQRVIGKRVIGSRETEPALAR